jgi:hypothetical protein
MKDYVITYTYLKQEHKVVWSGKNALDALETFWASFDEVDKKKVSNVTIFNLVEVSSYLA